MKTYSTQIRVGAEHIDKGNHANWRAQLAIAEEIHFAFRKELGFGLDQLQTQHELFLLMGTVKDVTYRRQLRLGDVVAIKGMVWISSLTRLEFKFLFLKDNEVATEMSWVMPLVSTKTERPVRIPQWMINAIGLEKPEAFHPAPASTQS